MTLLTRALNERETRQRRSAGEVLYLEGEQPSGVYLLHSGKVDLLFSARKHDVKPLRIVEAPQVLGVSELLSGKAHDCSATTRTACLIGFVDRERFLSILDEDPTVWFTVLQVLSEDINSCYASMRSLSVAR